MGFQLPHLGMVLVVAKVGETCGHTPDSNRRPSALQADALPLSECVSSVSRVAMANVAEPERLELRDQDSNLDRLVQSQEGCQLPHLGIESAPGRTRTSDLTLIRRALLPTELQAQRRGGGIRTRGPRKGACSFRDCRHKPDSATPPNEKGGRREGCGPGRPAWAPPRRLERSLCGARGRGLRRRRVDVLAPLGT